MLTNFSFTCPLISSPPILRLISAASMTVSPPLLRSSVCPQQLPWLSKEYGGAFHLKPTASLTASDSKHLKPPPHQSQGDRRALVRISAQGEGKNKSAVKMSSLLTSEERERRCLYHQTAGLWFTFASICTK